MLKRLLRLYLVSLFFVPAAALCPAQETTATHPQDAPAARSVDDLTIPELIAAATGRRMTGRIEEAVNLLRVVLGRDQTNVDALRMMGDIAFDRGSAEEARKYWNLVLQIQPSDFGANLGLGRVHLAIASYRSAAGYLATAAKAVPPDPPQLEANVYIALAQAQRGAGYLPQALASAEHAVQLVESQLKTKAVTPELETSHFDAWRALVALRTEMADRMKRQEDYDRALGYAKRLIEIAGEQLEINGTTAEGVQRLLTAYQMELGVLYAYRQVLFEMNPDGRLSDRIVSGMRQLAALVTAEIVDVMLRQADLERTVAHYRIVQLADKAVEYDGGTNPKTLMDLGTLQKLTGQTEAAIETFRRVLQIDPTNELAQQQLRELHAQPTAPPSEEPATQTP